MINQHAHGKIYRTTHRYPTTDAPPLTVLSHQEAPMSVSKKRPLEQRFWEKVNKNGPIPSQRPDLGPCWQWIGSIQGTGYGDIFVESLGNGRTFKKLAHRLSYEMNIGQIPDGLELDHLCRNRGCVNPQHLEPVTRKVNSLRGDHPISVAIRSGYCRKGHEMTPENTYTYPNGRTHRCRACQRDRYFKQIGGTTNDSHRRG